MEIKIHPHVSLVVGHKNFFFNKSKAHFETVFFFLLFLASGQKMQQFKSIHISFFELY